MGCLNIKTDIGWAEPASTEKFYFYNHCYLKKSESDLYFGFPWASLIDYQIKDLSEKNEIKNILSGFNGRKHTICQHINWRSLIGLWEEVGITDVHLSHLDKKTTSTDNLIFHSWPLLAVNYENKDRSDGLTFKSFDEKQYFASFIGAYREKDYINDIRFRLKEILRDEKDVLFDLYNEWFYDKIYYYKEVRKIEISEQDVVDYNNKTINYNMVLSDSIFSFCPSGAGPNTIRLWESMSVGTIPVIISDNWIYPSCKLHWSDFSIIIEENAVQDIMKILRSIPKERIHQMQINCINAYKQFRQMTCF